MPRPQVCVGARLASPSNLAQGWHTSARVECRNFAAMPQRKRLRLRGFDYASEGLYFVTVCTHRRRCVLGHIEDDEVRLSRIGCIVRAQIDGLAARLGVVVDSFVVMPNHVHLIVALGPKARQASPLRLGTVIGGFKSGSTRSAAARLWQRGYYEHVVRDADDLTRLREYIETNPIRWSVDRECFGAVSSRGFRYP